MATTNVLVPLKLDAFVLNEACCASDDYKIAPITQPNYTFLRLGLADYLLQSDILDHVDLHAAKPAALNARLTRLGSGVLRRPRLGVYLHWVLPPFYRGAIGSAPSAASSDADLKQQSGFPSRSTDPPPLSGAATDTVAPEFRPVPNRWLITRRLKPSSIPPGVDIPLFQSWVVQSDAKRRLSDPDDTSLDTLDLEVDVSPFVDTTLVTRDGNIQDNIIESQAEVFVGKTVDFEKWDASVADAEPRVDLNVMTSANPLLVDYQPHNSSIFSILDNFKYGDNKYLDTAEADYSVIGIIRWHSLADDDPMTTDPKAKEVPSHGKRLGHCNMILKDFDPLVPSNNKAWGAAVQEWYDRSGEPARADSRIVCHAAMYDVKWDMKKLPASVLAEKAGQIQKSLSFAVGTSPLDALVAFFEALAVGDAGFQSAKDDILRLIHILGETSDGDIDSLQKFSDEAYNLAFAKHDAGTTWFWKQLTGAGGGAPAQASPDEIGNLDNLNLNQSALDNLNREVQDLRWKLFALWWTFVSSYEAQNHDGYFRDKLRPCLQRLIDLGPNPTSTGILKSLQDVVEQDHDPTKHTSSSSPSFFQRKDPTMLFAGIDSGWEGDFSAAVQVRLDKQAIPDDGGSDSGWEGHGERFAHFASKVPAPVQAGVAALLSEWFALRSTKQVISPPDPASQVLPYFHETQRDLWQETQPWKPLFIEWEALYYHIPFEHWVVEEYADENKFGANVLRYTVHDNVSLLFDQKAEDKNDLIRIAGRSYLQPQSQSTFKTLLEQVFQNTNPSDLQDQFGLSKSDQQGLVDTLTSGKFVSAPLTAITNALLTLSEGAHLKPLVRLPHARPVAMQQAVDTFTRICPADLKMDGKTLDPTSILQLVDDQGDLTPFGSSVAIDMAHYPLKPVQHGHVQFVKLNVIDKFGQAIHLVDPRPPVDGLFNSTSPIISSSLSVGALADDKGGSGPRANTPLVQSDPDACPFFALPPSINQPARMNAVFVQKQQVGSDWKWRRISDWDSPVWGWIVVNYADSGLQFFLDNGQFYREVRFSSRGAVTSFKYLPFDPPPTGSATEAGKLKQLDHLIDQFKSAAYLQAFWDMINNSFTQASFSQAPTSYANFSSAVVGRPLALVNAGWSLQLANAPKENWTTSDIAGTVQVPSPQPPRTLLKPDATLAWANRQWQPGDDGGFTFAVKIGDPSRRYDGLVGYFLPAPSLQESTSDLELDCIYTFGEFMQGNGEKEEKGAKAPTVAVAADPHTKDDPRVKIVASNYPRHTPYWMAPLKAGEPLDRHDDKLHVLGLLMDPFLPVHAFSGILPTQALTLPPWIVERALKRMTAFWHVGPLLVPGDVDLGPAQLRPLDASYAQVLAQYAQGGPPDGSTPTPPPAAGKGETPKETAASLPTVQLPLSAPTGAADGGGGKFIYMQPYLDGGADGAAAPRTRFNPYVIDGQAASGTDAAAAQLAAGPYTALEGYVQVAKALESDDTPAPG